MNSMTGFGYAEGEDFGVHLSVEIKALNNRFLDLIISLPASLSGFERQVREALHGCFVRGRIEAAVRARDIEEPLTITVDEAAAAEWKAALERLSGFLGAREDVSLDLLTRQDGVFKISRGRDPEVYWKILKPLLTSACAQVQADRHREGEQLQRDIALQIARIRESLARIAERAHEIKAEVEEALRSRFHEILGDEAGEQRVLLETASWIARTDINEEIVRLQAHIEAFTEEAFTEKSRSGADPAAPGVAGAEAPSAGVSVPPTAGPAAGAEALSGAEAAGDADALKDSAAGTAAAGAAAKGRKLDFLAQEMGREINTIGSKTPRADVSRRVVEMKDALEKVREQLRNVE